ncbi:MAG: peroxiredoxin [Bacteroidales bacterium]|nr:peroxiredoxin [Bacteroidales bacterium]
MKSALGIVLFSLLFNISGIDTSINIGDSVPDFLAKDEEGKDWKLSDHYRHDYIVLYFYPAAFTGGCTKQACSYRDQNKDFENLNALVAGISGDDYKTLAMFKKQHGLNFTLLSDPKGQIAEIFGVPFNEGGSTEQEIEGQSLTLERGVTTSRWTVVVDGRGKLIYRDNDVNAAEDSETVIKFLTAHKSRKSCVAH